MVTSSQPPAASAADAFDMFFAYYADGTRRAAQPDVEHEGAAHGHQQPTASN